MKQKGGKMKVRQLLNPCFSFAPDRKLQTKTGVKALFIRLRNRYLTCERFGCGETVTLPGPRTRSGLARTETWLGSGLLRVEPLAEDSEC